MKQNFYYLLLILFFSSFAYVSCSSDSPDEEKTGPETNANSIEAVVNELEKNGSFSQFAAKLKLVDNTGDPLTIFAISDAALYNRGIELTTEQAIHHIVKGKYDNNTLLKTQKIKTLSGTELDVDFISDPGEEDIIYLNDIVLGKLYCQKENFNIYIIDKIIPKSNTPPSSSNKKEYYEWLADKLEGRWIARHVNSYKVRLDHYGAEVIRTVTPEKKIAGYENQCYLTFKKDRTYENESIYGTLKVTNSGLANPPIPEFGEEGKQDYYWYGLSVVTEGRIDMRNYARLSFGAFRPIGSVHIYPKLGIGKLMTIGTSETGYTINPPMFYPTERDSTSFTLQKLANNP